MELLSQNVTIANITVEISVHDLSFRMGFQSGEIPQNHLYVSLTARDSMGIRLWTTPLLTEHGKIEAFSTVSEAILKAKERIGAHPSVKADQTQG